MCSYNVCHIFLIVMNLKLLVTSSSNEAINGIDRMTGIIKKSDLIRSRTRRDSTCDPGYPIDEHIDGTLSLLKGAIKRKGTIKLKDRNYLNIPGIGLRIKLKNGKIKNGHDFRRTDPCLLTCKNDSISLKMNLTFRELHVSYTFMLGIIFPVQREMVIRMKSPIFQVNAEDKQ